MSDPASTIHPAAEVAADATVGRASTIGARTILGAAARVGDECTIGRDVLIDDGVTLGDRVQVQHGALVYRGATIADGVLIGAGAILTNDRYPRAVTSTGELLREAERAVSPVSLEAGCTIGAGAVVVAGVTIGSWATVGAGAVVSRDVPNYALVVGSPAHRIGWVCACGARLLDSKGEPMAAEPGRYAAHQELICPACGRTYAYVADAETLEERTGPRTATPV